jgi:nitrate reductase cytochrome c-type subunit
MYSGHIPAMSWAEAETLVPFAIVDGELVEEHKPCLTCHGITKRDLTRPMPV